MQFGLYIYIYISSSILFICFLIPTCIFIWFITFSLTCQAHHLQDKSLRHNPFFTPLNRACALFDTKYFLSSNISPLYYSRNFDKQYSIIGPVSFSVTMNKKEMNAHLYQALRMLLDSIYIYGYCKWCLQI